CWGTGELLQYDVTDPFAPVLTGKIEIGGIVARAPHPRSPAVARKRGRRQDRDRRDRGARGAPGVAGGGAKRRSADGRAESRWPAGVLHQFAVHAVGCSVLS